MYIASNHSAKINHSPFKNDWNDYQHIATQGRYIEPKLFSGFSSKQQIRLSTAKRQLFNPRLPSIRRIERDEILCRLADEHCRHTTTLTEAQFQNIDPKREESLIEFSGLNWHTTGKALLGVNEPSFVRNDSSFAFGSRLRPDKSQKETYFTPSKLFRSSSLNTKSPSATLTMPIQYSYLTNRTDGFEQNSRTRFYRSRKDSAGPTEGIFRSSSMYLAQSAHLRSPSGHNDGPKSSRV